MNNLRGFCSGYWVCRCRALQFNGCTIHLPRNWSLQYLYSSRCSSHSRCPLRHHLPLGKSWKVPLRTGEQTRQECGKSFGMWFRKPKTISIKPIMITSPALLIKYLAVFADAAKKRWSRASQKMGRRRLWSVPKYKSKENVTHMDVIEPIKLKLQPKPPLLVPTEKSFDFYLRM